MRQDAYKVILKYVSLVVLVVCHVSLFAYLWFSYYVPILIILRRHFFFWGNWAVVGLYFLFVIFFIRSFDGHKLVFLKARSTFVTHSLAVFFANVVAVLQSWVIGRYYFSILPILLLTVVQVFIIVIWSIIIRRIYIHINKSVKIAVIHGACAPNAFQAFLEKSNLHNEALYKLSIFDIDKNESEVFDGILAQNEIILYDLPSEKRNSLLKFCYENSKSVYITPKISDILVSGAEKINLSDTPLLKVSRRGFSVEALFVKRVLDITLAIVGLVITSPILLISAIIVKAYDGGSVFFKQERLTRNGKSFQIIKFRSMREDSEAGGIQLAKQDDERITPFGKFMRATHLDELPQLINIIKGDMTFVGPRPERIENIRKYEKIIPEFRYRLVVKAGLTGYAQLYGRYNTTPYDKLKLDLEYIEKHSLLLDLKLIILTVKTLFQRENSMGVKEWQEDALLDESYNEGKENKEV